MTRRPFRPWSVVLAAALLAATVSSLGQGAGAEGPAKEAPAAPKIATDEEAAAALERFQEDFKAKGAKGDEKTALREMAMRALAKVQHPLVADRLAKLTKDSDADIRTLATMYLGEQKAIPGYAGPLVVAALQKNVGDAVFVMFSGDSLASLRYRGALEVLRSLLKHKNEAVKKHALTVIGEMKEMRMLPDILQLMIDLKIDKGEKWEGGEVTVDTGAAGDADQKAAEAAYHAKYGQNAAKGKAAGRSMRDMKPTLLDAMRALTGQEFATSKQAQDWIEKNKADIEAKQKALNDEEAAQKAAAEALK